jgi:hypothetical protein
MRERHNKIPIIDIDCFAFIVGSLYQAVNNIFFAKAGMGVKLGEGSGNMKPTAMRSPTPKSITVGGGVTFALSSESMVPYCGDRYSVWIAEMLHPAVLAADGKHRIGDGTAAIAIGDTQLLSGRSGKVGEPQNDDAPFDNRYLLVTSGHHCTPSSCDLSWSRSEDRRRLGKSRWCVIQ